VDEDGDGYPVSRDCNDQDASVHPGAREKKRDSTDQDCNGYDLTIDVKYASIRTTGASWPCASPVRCAPVPRSKSWEWAAHVAGGASRLDLGAGTPRAR